MAKFLVQLVTRVPLFADIVVEADNEADARRYMGIMRDDAHPQLAGLKWRHGEGAEHAITFGLDERDLAEIEVQGVSEIDKRILRIQAFHAEHGEAWGIIENSGHENERHTGALFGTPTEAWKHVAEQYDADEKTSLHIDVAHWDTDGGFWSYDH